MSYRDMLRFLGWSQSELARRLGVLPSTVSDWKDSPPTYAEAYLCLAVEMEQMRVTLEAALKPMRRK